jgi:hypothetical protein
LRKFWANPVNFGFEAEAESLGTSLARALGTSQTLRELAHSFSSLVHAVVSPFCHIVAKQTVINALLFKHPAEVQ